MKAAKAVLFGAIIVFVGAAERVDATSYLWNTTTGSYDVGGSWNPVGVPTSADSVRFLNGYGGAANYIVNFNQNEAASYMGADNAFALPYNTTFNLNGYTWTTGTGGAAFIGGGSLPTSAIVTGGGVWDNSANFLNVGNGDAIGNLTINSGTTVRALVPEIGHQATGPNASTLWVKSGGVLEANVNSGWQVGNINNHAATITGAGTIRPTAANGTFTRIENYGIIAPGDAGTGTLTMQDTHLFLHDGSKLAMEIGGTGAGQYDQLLLTTNTDSGGLISFYPSAAIELNFLSSYTNGVYGDYFDLVVGAHGQIFPNGALPVYSLSSVTNYEVRLDLVTLPGGTQDALRLFIVPEPMSAMLVGLGGLLLFRRRR